jgi:hypothetical protein
VKLKQSLLNAVFKVPGEDVEDNEELSTDAPLLHGGTRRIQRLEDDELEELMNTDGPKSGVKGTMMDGIANVSSARRVWAWAEILF